MPSLSHSAVPPAPLVSVSITAFNSEEWLPRALDSVLLQRTSFPIEIVIGDDHSMDGTVAIARSYQERNPLPIRVLERSKNLGMQGNYYETFEQCRGKYIAWLDADDYWTAPDKLTIQAQLLESDSSVSACGHFVRWVMRDGRLVRERHPSISPGRYGLGEIIRHCIAPSPSIVFRNGIHRDLPKWYYGLKDMVDWPILALAALSGDIVLLDGVMADYVLTPGSAYMSKDSIYKDEMDVAFYKCTESFLSPKWRRNVRAMKGKRYESLAYALRKRGDFAASRRAALDAFRSPAPMDNCGSKTRALLAAIVGPWLS